MMESNNIDPTSSFGNGSIIHNPKLVDVLLGRGKPVQSHPGNQRMVSYIYGQHTLMDDFEMDIPSSTFATAPYNHFFLSW